MPLDAIENFQWILLGLVPFMAALLAVFVFNGIFRARNRELATRGDGWRNADYLTWREWVKAQGGVRPLFRARLFGLQDPCFAFEQDVSLYEPQEPCFQGGTVEEPLFDTPCGMPVGEGWSVLQAFGNVRLAGKGSLCVTAKEFIFRGMSGTVRIPLREIHTVVAACSSLLIGATTSGTPFVFGGVNGQKLRDIVSFLR